MREIRESVAGCLLFAIVTTTAYFVGAGLGWVILQVIKEFIN